MVIYLNTRLRGLEPPTVGTEVRCSIQLSHRRLIYKIMEEKINRMGERRDLNPRHPDPQSGALTN